MLIDYLSIGGTEAWNTVRLQTYLTNMGSPFTSGPDICGCPTITPAMLGDTAYDTPATDPAPWYDPVLPVSGDFLGFMPLSIDGLEDNPRARNVTGAVGGGGVFGPTRALSRTITVTGLILGMSCCAAEYGLSYMTEVLAGGRSDTCATCDGDTVEMFNCCPDTVLTRPVFLAQHRRTFKRTALVSGPTITQRVGNGGSCAKGSCGANGDILQVEFVFVAASPWPWTDPTDLLNVNLPIGGTGDCIQWCQTVVVGDTEPLCVPGECIHASCTAAVNPCADPTRVVPVPPVPLAPDAGFCIPLGAERACYTVDLTARPAWFDDVPIVTVSAGSTELRNVRVTIYNKPNPTVLTCDQVADLERCSPVNDFIITYLPVGGSATIDGRTGRATATCAGVCGSASMVFGSSDGGPVRITGMPPGMYCICLETDPSFPPAVDATMTLSVSGRVY